MEVAIVSGIDPVSTKPGGTRSYVLGLAEKLSGKGIGVTLLGISGKTKIEKEYNFKPIVKKSRTTSKRFLVNLFFKTPFLKISKDTIIHVQRPDALFPFVLFKRKNPKVCTIHGIPGVSIRKRKDRVTSGTFNILERFGIKRADRVIVVDTRAREHYLREFRQLKGKIDVIPTGIDPEVFKPMDKKSARKKHGFNPTEKIILYMGRLEGEKRVDMIIESFMKLKDQFNAKLVIVGEGPEMNRLQKLAKNPGIRFMGTVPHEQIPEILNCVDALVMCSEYEGMPTVVLEALACGIPVVSTDVGDVSKIVVDGKTGYLSKANVGDLKQKILMVLKNSEEFKHACIDMAKKYSWDIITDKVIEVYKEAYDGISKKS